MPTYDSVLSFIQGSDRFISRTISFSASGYATGTSATLAWLTVKSSRSDADPGLFQKEVTTVNVVGTGQIEEDGQTGGVDQDIVVRFDVNAADTLLLDERPAYWSVKLKLSSGNFDVVETGIIWARRQVTTDTS